MKSLRPKSIQMPTPKTYDFEAIKEIIGSGLERMNRIRDGTMAAFKKFDLAPITIYDMANLLEFISMKEYQNMLVEFAEAKMNNKEYKKEIDMDVYKDYFKSSYAEAQEAWLTVIDIMKQEKIKAIELSRVAAELRTTGMENFINAVGSFIDQKKSEEKKDGK